jgi:hypothetical protein
MTIAGQLVIGALLVVAAFAIGALVEMIATLDLGATALCAIFAGLATAILCAIYPTAGR